MENKTEFEIRPFEAKDAEGVSTFIKTRFLRNSPTEIRSHEADYYAWKYRETDAGKPAAFVAESKGRIVGLFCVLPRTMMIHGKAHKIGETCDAYVDPEFQGKNVFYKLVAKVLAAIKEQGITSFYTTSNEITMKIWTGLFRFQNVYNYHGMLRLIRPSQVLKKKMNLGVLAPLFSWPVQLYYRGWFRGAQKPEKLSVRFTQSAFDDARLDQFWKTYGLQYPASLVKNSGYHAMRFGSGPEKYQLWILESEADVLGYVVLKYTSMFGMLCGHLIDFMVPFQNDAALGQLLAVTLNTIKQAGGDFASLWSTPDSWMFPVLKKFGFWPRKKMVHLVVGGDILKEPEMDTLRDPAQWLFQHGDSDNV